MKGGSFHLSCLLPSLSPLSSLSPFPSPPSIPPSLPFLLAPFPCWYSLPTDSPCCVPLVSLLSFCFSTFLRLWEEEGGFSFSFCFSCLFVCLFAFCFCFCFVFVFAFLLFAFCVCFSCFSFLVYGRHNSFICFVFCVTEGDRVSGR